MSAVQTNMRERFERYVSNDGTWAKSVEKDEKGRYKLLHSAAHWDTWQTAWQAALDQLAESRQEGV